jgi:hypothetical protein
MNFIQDKTAVQTPFGCVPGVSARNRGSHNNIVADPATCCPHTAATHNTGIATKAETTYTRLTVSPLPVPI